MTTPASLLPAAALPSRSLLAVALLALSLSACTGGGTDGSPVSATPASSLQGTIFGGQQPVVGSTVTVYAAGASYGTATALSPTAVTDANGAFNLSFTCPAGSPQLYVVASGGNPGFGVNSAAELSAAVGRCDEATLPAFLVINEVTTVASVYALSQFLNAAATQAGAPETNTLGLDNAVSTLANLADVSTGVAATALVTGASGTPPTATINTLANIIAACVNSNGPASSPCTTLFSNATPAGGTAPTTTLQATLNIARNPGINVAALYALNDANGPFQTPAPLAAAPNDWTLGIRYRAGSQISNPAGIALDAAGGIWVANSNSAGNVNAGAGSVARLDTNGVPAAGSPYFSGGLNSPGAIAIDATGNVWVASVNNSRIVEYGNTGALLSPAGGYTNGISGPTALAIDRGDNVWVTNGNSNAVTKLVKSGGYSSAVFSGASIGLSSAPGGLAIDSNGAAWVSSGFGNTLIKIGNDGTPAAGSPFSAGLSRPNGVAIDAGNSVWVANTFSDASINSGNGALIRYANDGSLLSPAIGYAGGALNQPSGARTVAIDGAGSVWVASTGGEDFNGGLSKFLNDGSAQTATRLVAGGTTAPSALAIDASGNIWAINFNSLVKLVGAAVPVATPLLPSAPLP